VILAGGQGTRLRPLTLARPKPIVPLLNVPFLRYQLALLALHGVEDVVLACSYLVDAVRAELGDGRDAGVRLRYAVEAEPLGTGGGTRHAAALTAGRLFVLNGDVLTDADLGEMGRFHEGRGARATLCLTPVADPTPYGLVECEADGRVRRFVEKPDPSQVTADTINAGIYLLERELLDLIPAGRPVSIEREVFPALLARGVPCFGFVARGYWIDIGSPDSYRRAQVDLLRGLVRTPVSPPGTRRGDVWIGEGAALAPTAALRGPAVIGPGARLAPEAVAGPLTVLGAGVSLGPGARVEGSVLWERVEVGERAVLQDAVVGAGARIGAGAYVEPGAVIADNENVP
jgi:NDP-sugar pyrophosphorylase family protein